eukprot:CAMPEP_0171099264 /NCGR_PEP_ID=MMETSP0766_2-20121228/50968_1 /TAXON_ID=439317 /ORGANISM="Gambierdiscus australes, Strain CAWD 149" /LENGTH=251 /DNA_ID=CAMNT_0011558843 /DNA_START=250 /DNA_END=1005 /DNA_ORIENTATION=-
MQSQLAHTNQHFPKVARDGNNHPQVKHPWLLAASTFATRAHPMGLAAMPSWCGGGEPWSRLTPDPVHFEVESWSPGRVPLYDSVLASGAASGFMAEHLNPVNRAEVVPTGQDQNPHCDGWTFLSPTSHLLVLEATTLSIRDLAMGEQGEVNRILVLAPPPAALSLCKSKRASHWKPGQAGRASASPPVGRDLLTSRRCCPGSQERLSRDGWDRTRRRGAPAHHKIPGQNPLASSGIHAHLCWWEGGFCAAV